MSDFITNIARFAFEAHQRGEIDKDKLIDVLQACVNARAEENGYADEFGLPFPDHDDDQSIPDEPTHPAMVCSYDEDDTGAGGEWPWDALAGGGGS